MTLVEKLDKRWFPNHTDDWDARAFRARIIEQLDTSKTLLDIGAGRGATQHMNFKGLAGQIIGTDLDPVVQINTQIDRAVHNEDGSLTGVEDSSVDIVVSKDVLEHVATQIPRAGKGTLKRLWSVTVMPSAKTSLLCHILRCHLL